ncbi:PepSY domain-containing protein [Oceanobacillus manasiensis]|uniref:PepSY domain-containing protein n=1 Tax=Oceanobacillus manasiensis TaxID=586413 RepID=UPI0005AA4231|nr:PepSY domain-containing protein [Oceanobacillus manasiensis]
MKKYNLTIMCVFILLTFTGCDNWHKDPKITEEEAKSIVIEDHPGGSDKVRIKSVSHSSGEYKVKWEIDADCNFGIDYIDDQSGEIVKSEASAC